MRQSAAASGLDEKPAHLALAFEANCGAIEVKLQLNAEDAGARAMPISRIRTFSIFVLAILGIACIIIGGLSDKDTPEHLKPWLAMAAIFGAALFGATLAMSIESFLGTEISDIRNYLFAREKFESAGDFLDTVVGEWHVYYLTVVEAGIIWKSAKYVLTRDGMQNTVRGTYDVTAPNGALRRYIIEAGLRGSSLILISRPAEGTETEAIEVIPKAINTHLGVHIGMGTLETWTGELAFTCSLYSRTPLTTGDLNQPQQHARLTDIFRRVAYAQKMYFLNPYLWGAPNSA